jgi:hypothetical protein
MLDKLLGFKLDPQKVNAYADVIMKKVSAIEQAFTGIDTSLKDLVDLKKQEIELLKKQVKK